MVSEKPPALATREKQKKNKTGGRLKEEKAEEGFYLQLPLLFSRSILAAWRDGGKG